MAQEKSVQQEKSGEKKSAAKRRGKSGKRSLPVDRYLNRELSWLAFNERVLAQAADESLPILERAKFLAIASGNLDEFMMVRVGGLKILQERNPDGKDPAGMTASQQLAAVAKKSHQMVQRQYDLYRGRVCPLLTAAGLVEVNLSEAPDVDRNALADRFRESVFPVLSPQSVSRERFPLLQGLGLHLCVRLAVDPKTRLGTHSAGPDSGDADEFALIPLGKTLPRVLPVPVVAGAGDRRHAYVRLESLAGHFIDEFFPGREVAECIAFRITRNADIELREDEASDLMGGMEEVLETRRFSRPVRLEYTSSASDEMIEFLRHALQLHQEDLYAIDGPVDLGFLFTLHGEEGFDQYRDAPWPAKPHPRVDPDETMFETIAAGDLMLVHPYDRFDSVVRMIEEAAVDPQVLAIKQVLYRTSKNSPVVAALERAAKRGKYVTAIVELKARFDEARNIEWAREMERAGVQVIYGIHGLKTHAKICIIVRQEPQGIVRYMHFGTGNYNEATAKLYGDVSVLTCDDVFGQDASAFFNAVTGASQPDVMEELAAAPTSMRRKIMDLIEGETRRSLQGQQGQITAKLNALVDTKVIDALYRASQAGVDIRLNVRGQCCLKPGVKGLSETIEVVSIVDRFLEHARVLCFRQGGEHKVFISSADWMPRNLDRRVELFVPVADRVSADRLKDILEIYFKDNTQSWQMLPSGDYERIETSERPVRSQRVLYERSLKAWEEAESNRRQTFRPIRASEVNSDRKSTS